VTFIEQPKARPADVEALVDAAERALMGLRVECRAEAKALDYALEPFRRDEREDSTQAFLQQRFFAQKDDLAARRRRKRAEQAERELTA
jgi:hypothetical protein